MRKLTQKDETLICNSYINKNKSVSQLAKEYEVHPSTISRILLKHGKRKSAVKVSNISENVRKELRKTLLGLGISDPNFVISTLENKFCLKLRKQKGIKIFEVKEWED